MAVTHTTAVRNTIANTVVDLVDAGGAGTIVFQDGSVNDSDVATLTFSTTAFDDAGSAGGNADGIAAADTITADNDCNAGTVSDFTVYSGAGTEIFTGTVDVAGQGGDITLSSLSIGKGDTISISSLTYEAPN